MSNSLLNISSKIASAKTYVALIYDVMQSIASEYNWDLVEFWKPDYEGGIFNLQANSKALNINIERFLEQTKVLTFPKNHYNNSLTTLLTQPYWIENLLDDKVLIRKEMALQAGFKSALVVPVLKEQKIVGVIFLYSTLSKQKNEVVDQGLLIIANQLSSEIERRRLHNTLSNFFELSPDIFCTLSSDTRFLKVGQSFLNLLNITKEEILNTNLLNWVCEHDADNCRKVLGKIIYTKTKSDFELCISNKQNKIFYIQWTINYVKTDDCFLMVGRDITAKKTMELELERNSLKLKLANDEIHSLVENANDIFFKLSKDNKIIEIRESVKSVLGFSAKEIAEKKLQFFLHPTEANTVINHFTQNSRNKVPTKNYIHRLKHKNNSWIWVNSTLSAMYAEDGTPLYFYGISKNINERYLLYLELIEEQGKYKQLFHDHPNSLLVFDAQTFKIIEVNDAAVKQYGYSKEEFLQLTIFSIRPQEDVEELRQLVESDRNKFLNGLFYESKWKHQKKNGETFYIQSSLHTINLNGVEAAIASIIDVTEMRKAKDALVESQDKYNNYLGLTTEGIWLCAYANPINTKHSTEQQIVDLFKNGYVKDCNDAFAKMYGVKSKSEIIGATISDLYDGDISKNYESLKKLVLNNYTIEDQITHEVDANGNKKIFLNNTFSIIKNEFVLETWGTQRDVTEKHKIENALLQSQRLYKTYVELCNEGIWRANLATPINCTLPLSQQVSQIVEQIEMAECNNAFAKLYGFDKLEEIDDKQHRLFFQALLKSNKNILHEFVENNYNGDNKLTYENDKFGNKKIFLNSYVGIVENDLLTQIWGTKLDVTEKQNTQTALQESELRYKLFIQNSTEGIYRCETDVPVSTKLPAIEQITQFMQHAYLAECNDVISSRYNLGKSTDLSKVPIASFFTYQNDSKKIEGFTNFVKNGYVIKGMETIAKDAENNIRFLKSNLYGFVENGFLIRVWGTSEDITEQKDALSKIQYMASLVENVSDAIYSGFIDNKITYWNKAAEEVYGIKAEEIIGKKSLNEVIDIDTSPYTKEEIYNLAKLDGKWKGELSFIRPTDNKHITILTSINLFLLPNETEFTYVVTSKDITERKLAEKAILEREKYFHTMADTVPVKIWTTNEHDKSTYYNKRWLSFTGRTLEQELSQKWENNIHPADREIALKKYHESVSKQEKFDLEYRFLSKTGEYFWLIDRARPRYDENNKFEGYIGVCFNIEERIKAEQELKVFNERYEFINKATSDAVWDTDIVNNKTTWGIGYQKLFGYDVKNIEVTEEFWLSKVHPDDRQNAIEIFIQLNSKNKDKNVFDLEYRFLKSDGSYAYVQDIGYLIKSEDGTPIRMIGSTRDITEQKRLEEELINAEVEKQKIITKATLAGQEKERDELSKELHDNVNQLLASAKLYLAASKNENQKGKDDYIDNAIDYLMQAIDENRKITHNLAPPALGKYSLIDAVNNLIDLLKVADINVRFRFDEKLSTQLIPELQVNIYRIIQEQFNNILKYAKAQHVILTMLFNDNVVSISVIDDGVGFDVNGSTKGIGLRNITNRVSLFNGTVSLISSLGNGCELKVTLQS